MEGGGDENGAGKTVLVGDELCVFFSCVSLMNLMSKMMIFSLRVSASWTGGDLNIVTESSRCCLSIFLSVCPTLHRGVFLALILFFSRPSLLLLGRLRGDGEGGRGG